MMEKGKMRVLVRGLVINTLTSVDSIRNELYNVLPHEIMFTDMYTRFKLIAQNIEMLVDKSLDSFDKSVEENENVHMMGYEMIQRMYGTRFSDLFAFLLNTHLEILSLKDCVEKGYVSVTDYTTWCKDLQNGVTDMEARVFSSFKDKYFNSKVVVEMNLDEISDILFTKEDFKDNPFRKALLKMIDRIYQLGDDRDEDAINMVSRYILEYIEAGPIMHIRMSTPKSNLVRDLICTGDRDTFERVFNTYSIKFLSDKVYREYGPVVDDILKDFSFNQDVFTDILKTAVDDDGINHLTDGEITYTSERVDDIFHNGILDTIFLDIYNKVNTELEARGLKPLPIDKKNTKIEVPIVQKNILNYLIGQSQMFVKSVFDYVCNSSHNQFVRISNSIHEATSSIKDALSDGEDDKRPVAKKIKLNN